MHKIAVSFLSIAFTAALAATSYGTDQSQSTAVSYYTYDPTYSGADISFNSLGSSEVSNYDPYHNGYYSDGTVATGDGVTYNESYGVSSATPGDGYYDPISETYTAIPSYDQNQEYGGIGFTLTNSNQTTGEYADITLHYADYSQAQGDYDGGATAVAVSSLSNTDGDIISLSTRSTSGGDFDDYTEQQFSYFVGGVGYVDQTDSITLGPVDGLASGVTSLSFIYVAYVAPGQTERITNAESTLHEALATAPSPAAIAPFAFGLIAARRRRKSA